MPLSVESAGQGATAPRCFATGTGPGCSGRTPEVHECRHAAECTASAGPNGCRANESQAEPHARREADSPPLGHASCRADDACLLRRVQAYLRLPRHVQLSGSPLDRCWNEFYRRHAGSVRRILRTTAMSPADQADCSRGLGRIDRPSGRLDASGDRSAAPFSRLALDVHASQGRPAAHQSQQAPHLSAGGGDRPDRKPP